MEDNSCPNFYCNDSMTVLIFPSDPEEKANPYFGTNHSTKTILGTKYCKDFVLYKELDNSECFWIHKDIFKVISQVDHNCSYNTEGELIIEIDGKTALQLQLLL